MNIVTRLLLELQEMSLLAARAARGLFKKPRYIPETIAQMDSIGVGSLTIIILTGFFTGGVLTLQTYQTLASYGAVDQLGYLVAISLVRELGPVLTALMVTGRVVSAISAELGSMVVSEQIDAMRALGTDPIRKARSAAIDRADNYVAAVDSDRRRNGYCRRLGGINLSLRFAFVDVSEFSARRHHY